MTLVLLSVLQIYVPLLLVNSGDDPLVHNSLLTIPRTLSGIATVQVSCHLKDMERLKKIFILQEKVIGARPWHHLWYMKKRFIA